MIAVVAGASGLTGQAILEELRRRPEITNVLCPGRPEPNPWKPEDLAGDVYFCALGTTIRKAGSREAFRCIDHDLVIQFARACEQNGGKAFGLVSAAGASASSPFYYSRIKAEVEASVGSLSIPAVAIARPSLLIGRREQLRPLDRRPAEALAVGAWKALSPWLPERLRLLSGTRVEELARALVDAVLLPTAPRVVLQPTQFGAV